LPELFGRLVYRFQYTKYQRIDLLQSDGISFFQAEGLNHTILEKIKKTSSAWIKTCGQQYGSFFWQGGYGDFSIGWSQLEDLAHYIDNQEQHHRTRTFQEEYLNLLRRYHVEFDERYVWDWAGPISSDEARLQRSELSFLK
jgi:hypothetical protein